MKTLEQYFISIRNHCNAYKLKEQNAQLKSQVSILQKMLNDAQLEKQLNDSVLTDKLDALSLSIVQQSEKIGYITEKLDTLCPLEEGTTTKKDKNNKIATLIAIIFTFAVMIFNIIGISKLEDWKSAKCILVIIFKILEILISAELIFHTGLLAKMDKYNIYFWGSRFLCVTLILSCIHTRSYDDNYNMLNNTNSILSNIAFISAFLGNYMEHEHTHLQKKNKSHSETLIL